MELANVPFALPKGEGAKSPTMLRFNARMGGSLEGEAVSYDTPIDKFELKTPASVEIPVGGVRADSVFFAWACTRNWKILFQNNASSNVLKLSFKFEDGTEESAAVRIGSEIGDCRQAQAGDLRNAKLGASFQNPSNGDGEVADIYVFEWKSQFPERKLKSIQIKCEGNPPYDPMIFGISVLESSKTFI